MITKNGVTIPTDYEITIYNDCIKLLDWLSMTSTQYGKTGGPVLTPEDVVQTFGKLCDIVKKNEPNEFDLYIIQQLSTLGDDYLESIQDSALLLLKAYSERSYASTRKE